MDDDYGLDDAMGDLAGHVWEAWDRVLTGPLVAKVWAGAVAAGGAGWWILSNLERGIPWPVGALLLLGVPFAAFTTVTWRAKVVDERREVELRSGSHRLFPRAKLPPKQLSRKPRMRSFPRIRRDEPDLR
ncbi:MAG TPA: hypothetical protein VFQ39_20060 [Longimicrobium sp.]|nr:hypothetical protein [Longimicrobium sp.]